MCQWHAMCWIALEMIGNRLKPLNCSSWSHCLNISIKGMLSLHALYTVRKEGLQILEADRCLHKWCLLWHVDVCVLRKTYRLSKSLLLSKHFKLPWKKHLKPASEVGLGWFSWFKLVFWPISWLTGWPSCLAGRPVGLPAKAVLASLRLRLC